MKRKNFSFIAVLVIVVITAWNMNFTSKTDDILSDIALANIEALANESNDGSIIICCTPNDNFVCEMACNCGTIWRTGSVSKGRPVGLQGICLCGKKFENC